MGPGGCSWLVGVQLLLLLCDSGAPAAVIAPFTAPDLQGEALQPRDATAWLINSTVLIPAPQGEALQPRDATAWLVNSDLDCGRRLRFRKAGSVRRCCAEGACERAA